MSADQRRGPGRGADPADGPEPPRDDAVRPPAGPDPEDAPGPDTPGPDTPGPDTPRPAGGAAYPGAAVAGPPAEPVPGAPPADEHPEEPAPRDPAAPAADAPAGAAAPARRRRRDPLAALLITVLTLLLGFAFAVQVRNTGTDEDLAGAREEDLVRILDELNDSEDRLRAQIADQRAALRELTNTDSRSEAALQEARDRAEALGILNGTVAAQGPGLVMTIRDPEGEVRVADLLDAVQELRGAGAETMQIDGVRIGVSTAVTGEPGRLRVDGREVSSPYEIVVIGSPQDLQTAMNIPGGVVDRVGRQGGSVEIVQSDRVVVDALRPLDTPEYAAPDDGDD
ncbi:DUF881 domain-containing protein [Geodermatophilus sabuli]|uniref:Uncharacterized conserved protein YlxW, UPF0749 family n=1 Tax=Geodermatophilus sabuli TaxID=1564158 RepID=A0A285EBP7_9ACTN|nr:DUF881 domain-containing protein [Geodermatophilus sabuli]MBB3084320.1 uncharacterized protein YlxW (UPF0749 family) [Geodermatophilus sabuli]SNX96410.1 Uncharacterized conserved protein YlxW, UPF0749 family [Geodermatophilus sabuli]